MLNSEQWRVFFVMPSEYSEATLPKPNNPDVKIRSVPTKYYAVFNYSGFNGTGKIQEYSDEGSESDDEDEDEGDGSDDDYQARRNKHH